MLEKKQIFNYCGSPKNYVTLLVPSQRDDKALQKNEETLYTITQEFIAIGNTDLSKKGQSFQRYTQGLQVSNDNNITQSYHIV